MNANILIVEDDKVCAQLFKRTLKEENYNVFNIYDGKDVVQTATNNNIDVILLDIIMPEISGYDVLKQLQGPEGLPDIPVIIVTSLTSPGEVKYALEQGALDFIRKPCEPVELIARVNSALRLKRKQDKLNDMAQRDALTNLYNRWYFNRTLEQYTSAQSNNGVSLIMIDCDNFKIINDKYGHSIGDEVLAAVANVLKKSTKSSDIACRFGGEEMSLIMPNTTIVQAFSVAERVRKNIAKMRLSYDGESLSLTISCGVCNINQLREKTARALINAADEALYKAKKNGRNRSEFYKETPTESQ